MRFQTRFLFFAAILAAATPGVLAQNPSGADDAVRIGPGVQPPRLLRKKEPDYSPDARTQRIQGTVVFQLIIDEKGRPTNISVVSPLGFGLDERAQTAIEKWEFDPGTKNGKPSRSGARSR
jgi:TonB family protein